MKQRIIGLRYELDCGHTVPVGPEMLTDMVCGECSPPLCFSVNVPYDQSLPPSLWHMDGRFAAIAIEPIQSAGTSRRFAFTIQLREPERTNP